MAKDDYQWNFHERDIAFLKDVGLMETKIVAQKHHMTNVRSVSNSLQRIQRRITRCQNYVNAIRNLQKDNARIRKKTTSGRVPQKKKTESFIATAKAEETSEEEF